MTFGSAGADLLLYARAPPTGGGRGGRGGRSLRAIGHGAWVLGPRPQESC
jgi:hypothetical protein